MTKPKFILVDPSFTDSGGDKWQYAITFARSAHKQGYQFILLTHKHAPKIQRHVRFGVLQRNVFAHAFFEHDKIVEQVRDNSSANLKNALNLRIERAEEFYSASIEHAKNARDWSKERLLRLKRALQIGKSSVASLAVAAYEKYASEDYYEVNADLFAAALAKELDGLRLKKGDRIFFHTMTQAMMESLAEVSLNLRLATPLDVDAHFLFHFGCDAPDAKTFINRYYSYAHITTLKQRLLVGSPFHRIHIHATSEILAEELGQALNVPVSVFAGLTNYDHYLAAVGGEAQRLSLRQNAVDDVASGGRVRLVVRASDLDLERAVAVSRTAHLIQHRGFSVDLRILYTDMSLGKLRELLSVCDFPFFSLVNTNRNDDYLRELVRATVVLLPYVVAKYEKRVSAVLHDAAVLGVPAVVPAGSTLADSTMCAAAYAYSDLDSMLGVTLNAVRSLRRDSRFVEQRAELARKRYASDVVQRLTQAASFPSLSVSKRQGIVNIVQPMWGRCGSSTIFESQINLLTEAGYFVNQILLASDPIDLSVSHHYVWKMLKENSVNTRGCVQRVFFPIKKKPRAIVGRTYFEQLANTIASARIRSKSVKHHIAAADITIVNHVFNSKWAFKYCGGRKVLESHDIQSIAFASRSVKNAKTGRVELVENMLRDERSQIARFDCVVNCAADEHAVLSEFNSSSILVTPHVTKRALVASRTLRQLAIDNDWHESYHSLEHFDLIIAGDGHPANVASTVWFIRDVFVPHLQKHGVTLVLCGRLSDEIFEILGGIAYLFYAGFVDDLDNIRALSHLVVLPDRAGTGISIKTLDAFATGMAFIGTSHSFRGLPRPFPEGLAGLDDPRAMAKEILVALRNPKRRAGLSELANSCYKHFSSIEVWRPRWEQALQTTKRNVRDGARKDSNAGVRQDARQPV